MSRRNHPDQKATRRKERLNRPLPAETNMKIAVCGQCGDYTHVWLPAGICKECLEEHL